ncbi:hypothetical protein AAEX28_03575 [Lentisphaerota bacterium WC36G]|nr:hypothetical protein LJT99_06450 [Lentisphaerae bacterium WC36]
MSYELIYTSAPKGLVPSSSGFCIVAHTEGLVANVANTLISCSGYKALYPAHSDQANENPTVYSHYLWNGNGKKYSIVSRIAFAGLDYTKRDNKLAHHLVLEHDRDLLGRGCGVGSVFESGFFITQWDMEPHLIQRQPQIPEVNFELPTKISLWKKYSGTKATAGVIAQVFRDKLKQNIYVINKNFEDNLPLVYEIFALLTPEERWAFTFNTYAESVPQSLECFLRFCTNNSSTLVKARMSTNSLIIDLSESDFDQKCYKINQLCEPYLNMPLVVSALKDYVEDRDKFLFELPKNESDLTKHGKIHREVPVHSSIINESSIDKKNENYQQRIENFTNKIISKNSDINNDDHDKFLEELEKNSVPINNNKDVFDKYHKKLRLWLTLTITGAAVSLLIIGAFVAWLAIKFIQPDFNKKDNLKNNDASQNISKDNKKIDGLNKKINSLSDKVITNKNNLPKTQKKSELEGKKNNKQVSQLAKSDERFSVKRKKNLDKLNLFKVPPLTSEDLDSLNILVNLATKNEIVIPENIGVVAIKIVKKASSENSSLIVEREPANKILTFKIFRKSPATGKRLISEISFNKTNNKLAGLRDYIEKSLQNDFDFFINDDQITISNNPVKISIQGTIFDEKNSSLIFPYQFDSVINNVSSTFDLNNAQVAQNKLTIDNKEFIVKDQQNILDLKVAILEDELVKKHWNQFVALQQIVKKERKDLVVIDNALDWWKIVSVYDNLINGPHEEYKDSTKKYLKAFYFLRQSVLEVPDKLKITLFLKEKDSLIASEEALKVIFTREGGIDE